MNYCECGKAISKNAKRCAPCAQKNRFKNKENHPMFGRTHSKEAKNKMSIKHSGKNNHMYGKRFYGKDNPNFKGRVMPNCKICGKALSRHNSTICIDCYNKNRYGSNNPNYKGGTSTLNLAIRSLKKYNNWHYDCLERDNYKCQECGQYGGDLEVHHKVPVNKIIKDYNLKSIIEAIKCNFLWDTENGITYCKKCHEKIDKYRFIGDLVCV